LGSRGSFGSELRSNLGQAILLRHLWRPPRRGFSDHVGLFLEPATRMFVAVLPADDVPDLDRDILINRAGVRFLFSDAEPGQQLEDPIVWNLELSSQLVDANLTHI
jgi:hypothetical protein